MEFEKFAKIHRYSRECIITEKIDGTNAQIYIASGHDDLPEATSLGTHDDLGIWAGSRNRWLYLGKQDNMGFAGWVEEHAKELIEGLGAGRHYGEWWGRGIARGYGLDHKRFSLFNTTRWTEAHPFCCFVVPVLWTGLFDQVFVDSQTAIDVALEELRYSGSKAAPGFDRPEGIVIYHTQGNVAFKKTIEGDEAGKGHGA